MEVVKVWEEESVKLPALYSRTIKVLFAPDRHNVEDLTFTFASVDPGGQTDYHTHDRPELIHIVSGRGVGICDGESVAVEPDVILYVRAGEKHQMKNTGPETLKLATVFVPAITAEFNYNRCLKGAVSSEVEE
jgi:mannose-6-phosphate isomerase-like protein (cupin superfamily)